MSSIAFTAAPFTAAPFAAAPATERAATRSASARPASARPRLRITPRGRLVLGVLLSVGLALVLLLSGLIQPVLGEQPASAGDVVSSAGYDYISVEAGESLWDLAAWIAPDADRREVVAQLVALNQLTTTQVQPGQLLAIPTAFAG